MRIRIDGRYQTIYLIDEGKSIGIVVPKGRRISEKLIQDLKNKSPRLKSIYLQKIQHVKVISSHILQAMDQTYFLKGVLYYYTDRLVKVSWTFNHEITTFGETKSLPSLEFFLLLHKRGGES